MPWAAERDTGRAWWVVTGCAIASAFGLMSILVGAIPTLAVEMERDTGWSRGAIMGTIGVVVLMGAVLGPYVGKLVDKQGARPWIIGGQVGLCLALVASAYVGDSLAAFYSMILLSGIFAVGTSPVSYGKLIVPWFDRKRGIALGISAVGVGISAIILPLVTAPMAEAFGWRQTLAIYGIAALALTLPIQYFLVREYPGDASDVPSMPDTSQFLKVFAQTWRDSTSFRVIILIFAVMGTAHAGIVLNMVPMQEDNGMSKALAAGTQSALGVTLILGRVAGGWLLDRFDNPKPLLFGIVPALVGIALLGFVTDWRLVYLAACLIGFGSGIENDGIPYLVSRYFPQEHFAKLSASIMSFSALALAFGPALAAITHDATGDYRLACTISAGLLGLVAMMVYILPPYRETGEAKGTTYAGAAS